MKLIKTKSFELACNLKGNDQSPKLTFVLPGRLDTKDYPHMKSHVEFLAGRGYLALSFDPPGTWESPGDIKLYTMTNYLKAVNELIEYFGNRPTFVLGHSRGGGMALISAVQNQFITHLVCIMGKYSYTPDVYTLRASERNWKDQGYLLEKRENPFHPEQIITYKLPYLFFEDSKQYDVGRELGQCLKPKLFVYGIKDTTVDPEIIKKAYQLSAPPKEIASVDSNHDYRFSTQLIQTVNELVGKFLDKYQV